MIAGIAEQRGEVQVEFFRRAPELRSFELRGHRDEDLPVLDVLSRLDEHRLHRARVRGDDRTPALDAHERLARRVLADVEHDDVDDRGHERAEDDAIRPREPARVEAEDVALGTPAEKLALRRRHVELRERELDPCARLFDRRTHAGEHEAAAQVRVLLANGQRGLRDANELLVPATLGSRGGRYLTPC